MYSTSARTVFTAWRFRTAASSVIVLIGKTWLSRFAIFRKVLSQQFFLFLFFFLFRCYVYHRSRQFKYKTFCESYKANINWKTFSLRCCAEAAISPPLYLFIVFSKLYLYTYQSYIISNINFCKEVTRSVIKWFYRYPYIVIACVCVCMCVCVCV